MSKLVEFSMANGKLGFALAVESTVVSSMSVLRMCSLGLFAALNGRPNLIAGAGIPPLPLHSSDLLAAVCYTAAETAEAKVA